jgi:hypothetical protein
MDNAGQIAIEPPQVSEVTERRIHDAASEHMMRKTTQEELQAATNATLRAHATSDDAKALVARLAAKVDEHAHAAEPLL